jgi:hypothetical protein
MAYKDLHDSPFDGTTIAKLEIFEDYPGIGGSPDPALFNICIWL